jgi:D-amino-acid dehydrogenase
MATSILAGGEDVSGDLFVFAAGVHTGPLARLPGFPLPIQPGTGYGFDDTSGLVTLRHSIYLCEAKVAITPLSDRLRFAGTMEFGTSDATISSVVKGGQQATRIALTARPFAPQRFASRRGRREDPVNII